MGDSTLPSMEPAEEHQRAASPASKPESDAHSLHDIPAEIEKPATPAPPPNGGYGWVCTVAVAMVNAHAWGINSSYGVFLDHYLEADVFPGATSLQFAFVGSLSIGCATLVSPLAATSVRLLGTTPTLLIGAVLQSGALIAASFAHRIWQLFLSQGLLFGIGLGFLFVASAPIVPQWFTTKRSLANGLATAGSGIGGLVYSLATGAMLKSVGQSWTFRILGIIAFAVNAVCAVIIKDRYKIIGSKNVAFDTQLFRRTEYLLVLAYGWFSMFAYVVLLFSLANYASSVGLTASQASLVSALFNLGQAVGRPCIGYFSDAIGRINMAFLASCLSAVFALAIWIPAKSFGVLVFYALIGGGVSGGYWTVIAPVTVEVVGLRDTPSALSMNWLAIAIPVIFSEPIGLEIVKFNHARYTGAQIFVGVMYVAAAGCVFMLRGWKIAEVNVVAQEKGVEPEQIDPITIDAENELVRTMSKKEGRRRMLVDMYKWAKV